MARPLPEDKPNYRYDEQGNLYVWSQSVGKYVMSKSATQLAREAKSKRLDIVARGKDTARGAMARRRKLRKRGSRVPASTVASQVPKVKPKTPKPTDKPEEKKTKITKPTSTPTTKSNTSASSSSAKPKAKKVAKKASVPVSQSRTMWVRKGTMVNGKEVKKGYLAQYGKPEKRVTASVKLVEDTKRGKAGEMVDYKKGRYKKKSGK